jgi:hypothetical protein
MRFTLNISITDRQLTQPPHGTEMFINVAAQTSELKAAEFIHFTDRSNIVPETNALCLS